MKKMLLFVALPLLGGAALAQDSTFQLKDYKYRTSGYRSLTVNLGLSGTMYSSNHESVYDYRDKGYSLRPAGLYYYKVQSTDQKVQTTSVVWDASGQGSSRKFEQKTSKSSSLQSNLTWQQDQRHYKSRKRYFEFGNEFTSNLYSTNINDTLFRRKQREATFSYTATFGLGKGRIEAVQDAQMALYILNDLQDQGLLQVPVTREQAESFAKLITSINNKRVFDFRRRRIYELTQIDSFLRASGLVETTTISHFTVINDNWGLAFNPMRLSGTIRYLKLMPNVKFYRRGEEQVSHLSDYSDRSNQWEVGVSPVIGLERYVPVSLKFQKNMGAQLTWQPARNLEHNRNSIGGYATENTYDFLSSVVQFNGFYGFGYFPNNRTLLNTTLSLEVDRFDNNESGIRRYWQCSPAFNFNADYFISYRTRLQARADMTYRYSTYILPLGDNRISNDFSGNFSVGLVHSFF